VSSPGSAKSAADQMTTGQMIGEALREMGILALVFGLLDCFLRSFFDRPIGIQTLAIWSSFVVACSLSMFLTGLLIERFRK